MSTQVADTVRRKAEVLESKARSRRAEATAARSQARAYGELAHACRQRIQALHKTAAADSALALLEEDPLHADIARSDGRRAMQQLSLLEAEAHRHESEARRALAEADRADAEAATALTRANVNGPLWA